MKSDEITKNKYKDYFVEPVPGGGGSSEFRLFYCDPLDNGKIRNLGLCSEKYKQEYQLRIGKEVKKESVRHISSERFHAFLKQMGDLHDKKQCDYGQPNDPFANVRASTEWGMPAWVGCMIRANDKIRRLQTMAKTGTLTNESARDSFMDLAVYSIIGLCLYEDDQEKLAKKSSKEL